MSVQIWPKIDPEECKRLEDITLANELAWLLDSLQETLESLKAGLDDCYALLAPVEPGSTLVISSVRSEAVKGTITRVGTRIVKGSLNFRLKTLNPVSFALDTNSPLILPPLQSLRTLLNSALDCVDITRWTGDRHSAPFMSSQLRLLHEILVDAKAHLKGSPLLDINTPNNSLPSDATWPSNLIDAACFTPRLPPDLTIELTLSEANLVLVVRIVEDANMPQNIGTKLAFAIGAKRALEHDEMDGVFTIPKLAGAPSQGGREVRVKEKVRVESGDPSLMSLLAKLSAVEHSVAQARYALKVVMEDDSED